MSNQNPSTYITYDIAGIGGKIKKRAEDLVIEEQLTYDLSGAGEYLYLFIETIGKKSSHTAQYLAQTFNVTCDKVTFISNNDSKTVSRQIFSVYLPAQDLRAEKEALYKLQNEHDNPKGDIKILWTDRHNTKLKEEYLTARQYVIRIRDVSPMDVIGAKQILDLLEKTNPPILRWPDVSGGVDEHGAYIRITFELEWEQKVDTILRELMKKN